MARLWKILFAAFCLMCVLPCHAEVKQDFRLGAGDSIHVAVFRNPELALDTRVTETGGINYPLLGVVQIGGMSISQAEERIAKGLRDGGFVHDPQVNINVITVRANLVSVLGQVSRPGLYPLDSANLHLSEVLALAGGISPSGGDRVVVKGTRDGKPYHKEVDLAGIFMDGQDTDDVLMMPRDEIYVPLAPMFYIYGEVQKPGSAIILRDMTVIQALAQGGGLTPRGTERNIELRRRLPNGEVQQMHPAMSDKVMPNDVLFVHESLF